MIRLKKRKKKIKTKVSGKNEKRKLKEIRRQKEDEEILESLLIKDN